VGLLVWFAIRPPAAPKVFFRMLRTRGGRVSGDGERSGQ
jgi:hypothetical protein